MRFSSILRAILTQWRNIIVELILSIHILWVSIIGGMGEKFVDVHLGDNNNNSSSSNSNSNDHTIVSDKQQNKTANK